MANSNYYIQSGAISIVPNPKSGDPHYVGITVTGGAAIKVRNYLTDANGNRVEVGYAADLSYRKWTLSGGNTNVLDDYDKALYIYARLDASTSGTTGLVMLSASDHDVKEDDYFYIKLGVLSAPDSESNLRTFDGLDTGELETSQGVDNSKNGDFAKAFTVMGTYIMAMLPFSSIKILAGYSLTLADVVINAVRTATEGFANWADANAIATTESIAAYIAAKISELDNRFLRKDQDDETVHQLTMYDAVVKGELQFDYVEAYSADKVTFRNSVKTEDTIYTKNIANDNGEDIKVKNNVEMSGADIKMDSGDVGTKSFDSDILTGHGWNIDKDGNAVLESAVIRQFLEVPELRYNRITVQSGTTWNAPAAGVVKRVVHSESEFSAEGDAGSFTAIQNEDGDYLGAAHEDYELDDLLLYPNGAKDDAPTYVFGVVELEQGEAIRVTASSVIGKITIYKADGDTLVEDYTVLTPLASAENVSELVYETATEGYYAWSFDVESGVNTSSAEIGTMVFAEDYLDLKLEQGEIGSFTADDICMGIFHNESGNATADDESNFQYAGFTTAYFKVTKVADYTEDGVTYTNGRVYYSLRSGYTCNPQQSMAIVGYGNFTDSSRQTSAYATRTFKRYLKGVNDYTISEGNIAMHLGKMDGGLLNSYSGYSAYLNNIYMAGTIKQLNNDGTEKITLNYRGEYSTSATYSYGDEVVGDNTLWVWINETSGNIEPSDSNVGYWTNVGGKGDSGKGIYSYIETFAICNASTETDMKKLSLTWNSTSVAPTEDNAYQWCKTVIKYTDNSSITLYRIVSEFADDGVGVASIVNYYCLSDNVNALQNATAWSTSRPTFTSGKYTWQKVVTILTDGSQFESTPICVQGERGSTGLTGALIRCRGKWSSSKSYVNNANYVDVVLYNNSFYKCEASCSGQQPMSNSNVLNSAYWSEFNEFENVATNVLLANQGYVDVLGAGSLFVGQSSTDDDATPRGTGWYMTNGQIQWQGVDANGNLIKGISLNSDGSLSCGDSGVLNLLASQLVCKNTAGEKTAWLDDLGNFTTAGIQSQLIQKCDGLSKFLDLFIACQGSTLVPSDDVTKDNWQTQEPTAYADMSFGDSYGNYTATAKGMSPLCNEGLWSISSGNRQPQFFCSLDMRAAQGVIELSYLPPYSTGGSTGGNLIGCVVLPYFAYNGYSNGVWSTQYMRTPTRMNDGNLSWITIQQIKSLVGRKVTIINKRKYALFVVNDNESWLTIEPEEYVTLEFVGEKNENVLLNYTDIYGNTVNRYVDTCKFYWRKVTTECFYSMNDSYLDDSNFGLNFTV